VRAANAWECVGLRIVVYRLLARLCKWHSHRRIFIVRWSPVASRLYQAEDNSC